MQLVTFDPITCCDCEGNEFTLDGGEAVQFYPSLMGEEGIRDFVDTVTEWSGLGIDAEYTAVPGINLALCTVEGDFGSDTSVRSGDWVVSVNNTLTVLSNKDFWGYFMVRRTGHMACDGDQCHCEDED